MNDFTFIMLQLIHIQTYINGQSCQIYKFTDLCSNEVPSETLALLANVHEH